MYNASFFRCLFSAALTVLLFVFFTGNLKAQHTVLKLATDDTSSSFQVVDNYNEIVLKLNADAGLYLGGFQNLGIIPATVSGTQLMWYPGKSAFRAGSTEGAEWSDVNIANCSVAMGNSTKASGLSSTALGYYTSALNTYCTALGSYTIADNFSSTAMGSYSDANGYICTAIGYYATASGYVATSIGTYTVSSGLFSTAIGCETTASGDYSLALGDLTTASGNYSTAMGNYIKAVNSGSFVIGDRSKATYDSSSANNQMTMRFAGGYRLYSSSDLSTGVYMNGGVGGWTNVCDRNKKENFRQIDGEQILEKIKTMQITEWNYKGTDPSVKYIGPVAQDFYAAFHLGGTDSLGINSICIDGINIAAIQALEKRTAELQKANEKMLQLEKLVAEQSAQLHAQQISFEELRNELMKIKNGQKNENITYTKQE
jgi:hypothetical protein